MTKKLEVLADEHWKYVEQTTFVLSGHSLHLLWTHLMSVI